MNHRTRALLVLLLLLSACGIKAAPRPPAYRPEAPAPAGAQAKTAPEVEAEDAPVETE